MHTEIAAFSQFLRDTLPVMDSRRQNAQPVKGLGEFLRIPLLQIQNNFYNRPLIPNKHQILSIYFDETFCGNLVNNFDCRAFSLFETVTGSRITTIDICDFTVHVLTSSVISSSYKRT